MFQILSLNNDRRQRMLNGSDFVAKTVNVVNWDYKRTTIEVQCILDQSYQNLDKIERKFSGEFYR